MKLIDKYALVTKIETRYYECLKRGKIIDAEYWNGKADAYRDMLVVVGTLEVKDPYEQCIQYDSIKGGIQAHAETYSFNIESELFNQLTKEQQKLWRKEIEQAVISGGNTGYLLAKDPRYKENLEVKEVDLESEMDKFYGIYRKNGITYDKSDNEVCFDWKDDELSEHEMRLAKHFFELGLKAQKGVDTWHLQEKEDIYDAVKDWGPYTFVCIMKDGTIQKFTGFMDEDCEGHINVHIDGANDDYDNVDDIVKWIEFT